MPRTDLEILSQVRIATPCSVGWDTMKGDDRVRHCAQCDKLVYNLAKLTAEEAVALLRAPGGPPCIQLWRRADGTVLTADCPVGLKMVARRRTRLALAAAMALGLLGGGAWAAQKVLAGRPAESRLMGLMDARQRMQGKVRGEPAPLGGKPQMPPKPRRKRRPRTIPPMPLPPCEMGDVLIEPTHPVPPCPAPGK